MIAHSSFVVVVVFFSEAFPGGLVLGPQLLETFGQFSPAVQIDFSNYYAP